MKISLPEKRLLSYMKSASPSKILEDGQKRLIPAVKRAAREVSAYKKLLAEHRIDIRKIRDEKSFKNNFPLIDKTFFALNDLPDLCAGSNIKDMRSAMVSSGFSDAAYSYGLTGRSRSKNMESQIDFLTYLLFGLTKETFFINCLGMGTRISTSFPFADTSVRPDMVIELIKKFSGYFRHFLLIGNTYFIKKVIEDAAEQGVCWSKLSAHIIIGEDWFPENYRSYLARLMGCELDDQGGENILSNFGACELALSLFRENSQTVNIRRMAEKDMKLKIALFGDTAKPCPILFQYFPFQIFMEEKDEELIFTDLSNESICPLIRYSTRDKGMLYTYDEMEAILKESGHTDCMPDLKLPFVAVMGRADKYIEIGALSFTPEDVKDGLYSDFEAAGATTGYFRMSKAQDRLRIEVQLKEKRDPSPELEKTFSQAIGHRVKTDFELVLYPYMKFPYGMGLVYENKFKYI